MSPLPFLRRRRPRVAAFTIVRDESLMLPRWVAYYGAQLGVEHLVVVDHGSTDGSTDTLPCRVVRNPPMEGPTFERARVRLASRVGRELLASHDAVIFTDCDEFLLADPDRYDGLVDYVAGHPDRPVSAGVGFNVVHRVDREPPLAADRPVLGQRRHGMFVPRLCKPSLKRVDAKWRYASHGIEAPFSVDPALLLAHLKYADADQLRAVGDQRFAVHRTTGLTEESAWARTGEELVADLTEVVTGRPDVPPLLDPQTLPLDAVLRERGGAWEAYGRREINAMRRGQLLRLPEKYDGLV